jgi:hypothetical protein
MTLEELREVNLTRIGEVVEENLGTLQSPLGK